MCTRPCFDATDCVSELGSGACCIIPGPGQVATICHPADWPDPGGDVCN